jgi:HEAT repeat protein
MRTVALPRISALVFITPCLLFAQQHSTNAGSPPQTNAPAQQQPTNPSAPPPTHEPTQQPATKPLVSVAGAQPTATRKVPQTPKEEAWQILDTACTGDKTSDRATAVRVLGLMPNNARARKLAEKALRDDKPEVRSAAAAVLGDMKSQEPAACS